MLNPRDKAFVAQHFDRFWSYVDQSAGPDACWRWTGRHSWNGTGVFRASTQEIASHRLAWCWSQDQPLIRGVAIRQSCGVKDCCNPAHLELALRTGMAGQFTEFNKLPAEACRALLRRVRAAAR